MNAVTKHWPTIRHQRCWLHKTANVLNKIPKTVQQRIKNASRYLDGGDTTKGT
ncbi:transposase [Candidatus Enterovibrio escicola]|uniref:transposase n=1 Tax=Candidatus Enterovibrio escicola TaxID=1927127 RepID=UPI00168072F2